MPPAVTRERGNPITLAIQSALMPAQGMFAKESTQSRAVVKGVGKEVEVRCCQHELRKYMSTYLHQPLPVGLFASQTQGSNAVLGTSTQQSPLGLHEIQAPCTWIAVILLCMYIGQDT